MNSVAAKLGGFAVVLVAVFGGALALGATAGPAVSAPPIAGAESHEEGEHAMTSEEPSTAQPPAAGGHDGQQTVTDGFPGGLAVSQDGYTFTPATIFLPVGQEQPFQFTITGPDEQPVRDYVVEHDKELHLIVVRRDLSEFRHVHPTRAADGTWSIPLTLDEAGEYRAFADFTPAGGRALTLGVDLHAAGAYTPQPLPEPVPSAEVDGYTVDLTGDLIAGTSSDLTLTVTRDGEAVTDLEPYLGAYGHLVALRDGDLAYLHVHPHGEPGDGRTAAGPEIAFAAEVPSAGTYRLFLDFQHDGVVRTAEFTVTAAGAGTGGVPGAPSEPAQPATSEAHGADDHTH